MSAHGSRFMRVKMIVHAAVWITVYVTMGAWLTKYMIWTLQDPLTKTDRPLPERDMVPLHVDPSEPGEEKRSKSDGNRVSEPVIPGHFHHIRSSYESDRFNFCIDCHGWLPHSRDKERRSFLNMHTVFTDCMVCHVELEKGVVPTEFAWRRLKDGSIGESVSIATTSWGDYGYKIMPVTRDADGIPQPWRLTKEEALSAEHKEQQDSLDSIEKTISIKRIHQRCIEKPLSCKRCHTKENAVVPFAKLGYDSERRAFLSSIEVVDILDENKVFHLPSLLEPNGVRQNGGTRNGSPGTTLPKPKEPSPKGRPNHE